MGGGNATVSLGQTKVGPAPGSLNGNQAQYGGGIYTDGAGGPTSVSLQSGTSARARLLGLLRSQIATEADPSVRVQVIEHEPGNEITWRWRRPLPS